MHRRPVRLAFVLATVLALVGPFAVGPAPRRRRQRRHASGRVARRGERGLRRDWSISAVVASSTWSATVQGSPTVVLVAGGSSSARYWTDDLLHPDAPRTMVMPAVAKFTRVCAYDRPGTYACIDEEIFPSRSDAVAQPRTAPEMV